MEKLPVLPESITILLMLIIGLVAQFFFFYWIVKEAVSDTLKPMAKFMKENSVVMKNLLAQIALKQGVEKSKIDEIINNEQQ